MKFYYDMDVGPCNEIYAEKDICVKYKIIGKTIQVVCMKEIYHDWRFFNTYSRKLEAFQWYVTWLYSAAKDIFNFKNTTLLSYFKCNFSKLST